MTQITICLVLFVAMLVLFFTNKLPMSFTALGAMILLVFTGCLDAPQSSPWRPCSWWPPA